MQFGYITAVQSSSGTRLQWNVDNFQVTVNPYRLTVSAASNFSGLAHVTLTAHDGPWGPNDSRGRTASQTIDVQVTNRSFDSVVQAQGPIGYYRLGEQAGTLASDASGYGNNGTLVGTATLAQPGALVGDANTAYKFTGGQVQVNLPQINTAEEARLGAEEGAR